MSELEMFQGSKRLQTQVLKVADNTVAIRCLDWDRDRFDIEFACVLLHCSGTEMPCSHRSLRFQEQAIHQYILLCLIVATVAPSHPIQHPFPSQPPTLTVASATAGNC